MPTTKILTASEARKNLYRLIDQASSGLTQFVIRLKKQEPVVLLSMEEYESLQETAEILSIPGALESIEAAKLEALEGKVIPLDDFPEKK
ncbi:MAG: type II toxin-antitoxin system prevent-host-death family antitoxin [Candidatus Pacebacteria bacterium CG_4_10_14_0_8_um_filter_42_14]|nr:MAG: type II toxin-antitoxin system prevent-host-death family antitoxin [Candidatus Pacebacteria bacterium CG_4_10_14_0_8_um_filter_42_14]